MRRSNRPGARAHAVCTACGVRRQIPWHLRLEPTHQPGVYVCKYCKPNVDRRPPTAEQKRNWQLRNRYGITTDQYDDMLAAQGGTCAICGRPPKNRRLYVDHDHDNGRVRGLLCASCNSSLEWMLERGPDARAYLAGGASVSPQM